LCNYRSYRTVLLSRAPSPTPGSNWRLATDRLVILRVSLWTHDWAVFKDRYKRMMRWCDWSLVAASAQDGTEQLERALSEVERLISEQGTLW